MTIISFNSSLQTNSSTYLLKCMFLPTRGIQQNFWGKILFKKLRLLNDKVHISLSLSLSLSFIEIAPADKATQYVGQKLVPEIDFKKVEKLED